MDRKSLAALSEIKQARVSERWTKALHDIRVTFADRTDHTYISLYWSPPSSVASGARQVIPSDVLFPPQGDYARVKIPSLTDLELVSAASVDRAARALRRSLRHF